MADAPTDSDRLRERLYRFRLLYGVALVAFVLDQVTKYWIANLSGLVLFQYPPKGGIEVLPGFFNIVYAVNFGAAWGILEGRGALLVLVAIAFLVLLYIARHSLELRKPLLQLIFGLIIGGIIGNAVDRLIHGYVIDFLDVDLQFYRWPTFNLADTFIVTGTLAYILLSFRDTSRAAEKKVRSGRSAP